MNVSEMEFVYFFLENTIEIMPLFIQQPITLVDSSHETSSLTPKFMGSSQIFEMWHCCTRELFSIHVDTICGYRANYKCE